MFCLPAGSCFKAFRRVGLVLSFGPLWHKWGVSGIDIKDLPLGWEKERKKIDTKEDLSPFIIPDLIIKVTSADIFQ